ncbi:VOC family protein [Azospirillum griseum]|uniref:VOC family protein n=1 Tax=Azospirillum griseum TaxID=2496639 RepID=A0A431VEN2_9PROT|nr:VOC family protein [Azospirillum griseum]RTR17858.1 VOC family protein [Azospirillum griseum]
MQPRISLVTLGVADLPRAQRFYEQGLGWTPSPAGNENVAFYQLNGMALGLYGRAALAEDAHLPDAGDPTRFGGITLAHNLPSKDAVDALMAEAERAGARILKPAQDVFWGGYSGYFADPDGHLWEIAWNPFFPLDADGNLSLTAE